MLYVVYSRLYSAGHVDPRCYMSRTGMVVVRGKDRKSNNCIGKLRNTLSLTPPCRRCISYDVNPPESADTDLVESNSSSFPSPEDNQKARYTVLW